MNVNEMVRWWKTFWLLRKHKQEAEIERELELNDAIEDAKKSMRVLRKTLVSLYGIDGNNISNH